MEQGAGERVAITINKRRGTHIWAGNSDKITYNGTLAKRNNRWIDESMFQWAARTFSKDIVVVGVAGENGDKAKRQYYINKWIKNRVTKVERERESKITVIVYRDNQYATR